MKVAVAVSGLPRFTENFNSLLKNLKNYNQIDWFFYFWKTDHSYDNRISPSWTNNKSDIYKKLVANLPENNFIADLSIVEMPKFDDRKQYNVMDIASPLRVWTMFYGLKQVGQIRKKYENCFGTYDLVIRTRADGTVDREIYLDRAKQWLNQQPQKTLIMPSNGRLGFVPIGQTLNPVNDNFAIGESHIMDIYFNAFDHIDQYTAEGIPITAESMLGYHLLKNNIKTPASDFNFDIGINNYCRWI